jgi:hypothetical protein
MRLFLGMVLGALLTVAVAFIHDTVVTSSVAAGATATDRQTIVNWNVVRSSARGLGANLRELDSRVREGWNKLSERVS